MDLPYVIMLTLASICTLYLCVNYLHIQSAITARMHNIEAMEEKLEQMRKENDALETSINTSIDLNEIYEIATKELGMVYAKKDQDVYKRQVWDHIFYYRRQTLLCDL